MNQYPVHIAETESDREAIYSFRYGIYFDQMKKHHVSADHQKRMLYDEGDAWATLYYVKVNDKIVATVRGMLGCDGPFIQREFQYYNIGLFETLFKHEEIAIATRFIIDMQYRKTKMTEEVMVAIYLRGLPRGIKLCLTTCDDFLLQLYQRYGFRTYGNPVQVSKNVKRHRIVLFVCDYNYLKQINSPFLPYFDKSFDDQGAYARIVTEQLGYPLSDGITPLSFKNKVKKAVYLAGLWLRKLPNKKLCLSLKKQTLKPHELRTS